MLNEIVKQYIKSSVLCWLAKVDENNTPNVSPKEVFNYFDDNTIIVANTSPKTLNNVNVNSNVCISFIDIFIQKGFKIKGIAKVINIEDNLYREYYKKLRSMCHFPIKNIFEITVKSIEQIVAPSYVFNENVTEEEQTLQAYETYKFFKKR